MSAAYKHISVLEKEVIEFLQIDKNKNFVDCTLGGGGHAKAILKLNKPKGKVLAFEMDERAIGAAKDRLKEYKDRLIVAHSSYAHLKEKIEELDFKNISGIVFDLGLSSDQLENTDRGFSFKDEGPLDMRFDPKHQKLTAEEIVLTWPEEKLFKIIREYGEEKQAKRLSRGLVTWRENFCKQKQKTLKTSMLVSAILRIFNIKESNLKRHRIHPATKVFQALRIAVNDELENIKKTLPQAVEVLEPGARLVVISFHSLEDRIVKNYFRGLSKGCICPPAIPMCICKHEASIRLINNKVIKPSKEEIDNNPRSRSAVMRVIEKI